MRQSIKDCYEVTQQLLTISSKIPDSLTDDIYNEINILLEKRGNILSQIKSPFTQEEEKIGSIIINSSKELDQNLMTIKNKLQQEIKNIKKRDKTVKSYLGYNTSYNDGIFYDRKK